MRIAFKDRRLQELLLHGERANQYPPAVYEAFVAAVLFIQQAADERDLYKAPGLHMERLQGKRKDNTVFD